MDDKYERGILRITLVFLIAAGILIPLGFVGIPASLLLVGGLLVLGGALYVAWQRTEDYDKYLSGLWLGPVIGAVVTLIGVAIGASAGELMALGGMTGIVGVINLLLRPVYRLVHYVVSGLLKLGREIREEGW